MNYKRILVFGAHPDDEMTMAGTMRKLSDEGVEVHVCISTDGCEGYAAPELRDRIVDIRKDEQVAADEVMGVTMRHQIGSPDMGLANDKETFLRFIEVIREVRPDAAFTQGPEDWHRDHINTCRLSLEALWQSGQPVSTQLGEPWRTPHVFYYKAVAAQRPHITIDCTGYAQIGWLARATQESQHILWGRSRDEFEAEAKRLREANVSYSESFWLTDRMVLAGFPDG